MSELKQAFEQVLWQVLERHYNIDRREPRVLTYKHIMMKDPVGDMAEQVTRIAEELIKQAMDQVARQSSTTSDPDDEADYYSGW